MLTATATALLTGALLGGLGPQPPPDPREKIGPNLVSGSATDPEPFEIVFVKGVSFSKDGSLVHYQRHNENRNGNKVGLVVIGYFVDVATGKVKRTYQVRRKPGYIGAADKAAWARAKTKAWADAFLKKHGFTKAKTQSRAPNDTVKLKFPGKKQPIGWLATWRTRRRLGWSFNAYRRKIKPGEKLDSGLGLSGQTKDGKQVVFRTHVPYLDYHFALYHETMWKWTRDNAYEMTMVCEGEEPPACEKLLKKRAFDKGSRRAFTGELTLYWSPDGSAFVAFWDDRQALGGPRPIVYRSVVTVHSVADRPPTALLPAATPKPAMKPAAMPPKKTAPGQMAAPPETVASMKPASRKTSPKKSGCGCHHTPMDAAGLILIALLGFFLLRERRRDG